MKLVSVSSFYRMPFDENTHIEDGVFINTRDGLFGVADGVSEAYSPSHPPLIYSPGYTSGQMATQKLCTMGTAAFTSFSVRQFLLCVNDAILLEHQTHKLDPVKGDDVGGASFAVCHVGSENIALVLGGDCFAFIKHKGRLSFFTNFDEAAFRLEDLDNKNYAKCLKQADGKKGLAWCAYWPEYRAKRLYASNKNIGSGGFATLNGDPTLQECWTFKRISWYSRPQFIVLGTDGLLPSHMTDPKDRDMLTIKFDELYEKGGLAAILKWRDETESSLFHITGWPEASAIELKFCK